MWMYRETLTLSAIGQNFCHVLIFHFKLPMPILCLHCLMVTIATVQQYLHNCSLQYNKSSDVTIHWAKVCVISYFLGVLEYMRCGLL